MKLYKRNIICVIKGVFCLLILLQQHVFAQSISELKANINPGQKTEEQLDILNVLGELLLVKSQAEALQYAQKAKRLATELKNQEGLADALTILGVLDGTYLSEPDKAYQRHEKAYRIYKRLYEEKKMDKWKLYQFLNERALPTYKHVLSSHSRKRKYKKAIEHYRKLNIEFTEYLTVLASDNREVMEVLSDAKNELDEKNLALSEKENQLSEKKTQLNLKEYELQKKRKAERKLVLEKLQLSGNLKQKELEALALADSLLESEIELVKQQSHTAKLADEKALHKAEAEKQKEEAKRHKAEVGRQRAWGYFLIGVISLGVILIVVVFVGLRIQQKANKLLKRQKEELALKNEEIHQQKEEISGQKDNIEQQHVELQQQNEEIEAQRDNLQELMAQLQGKNEQIEAQRDNLAGLNKEVISQRDTSDKLLLNILPGKIAQELKEKGQATPRHYDMVTVLFTDFKGFTQISEKLSPHQIIKELDYCFLRFDEIIEKYGLEKIKTIGDAYMCAGGLPVPNSTNAIDAVKAGLAMQEFMEEFKKEKLAENKPIWELRLGIHTGPLVAGVIGRNKFAYDIWGDTVNVAARMESSGTIGKVNISGNTYQLVKSYFNCTYRGKISAKNKGEVDMYFVERKSSLFQGIKNITSQNQFDAT